MANRVGVWRVSFSGSAHCKPNLRGIPHSGLASFSWSHEIRMFGLVMGAGSDQGVDAFGVITADSLGLRHPRLAARLGL